jgi:hypothetical protein
MGLIDKISRFFSPSGREDQAAYWIYVCCNHCGEKLQTRIDLNHDLSMDFTEAGRTRYICRKTLVGSERCFQRVEVVLVFDGQRRISERDISGGEFLDEQEYTAGEG